MNNNKLEDPYRLLHPVPALHGALSTVARESWCSDFDDVEKNQTCRSYVVKAIVSDHIPLMGSLEDVIERPIYNAITVCNASVPIYLHYGGNNAFFCDLETGLNGELKCINVEVVTKLPFDACWIARTFVNHLLDTQQLIRDDHCERVWFPLVISRIDLFCKFEDGLRPLFHQLILPVSHSLIIGPLGGRDVHADVAPYLSLIREAINATSPYYRLLCAYRLFEGINGFRQKLSKIKNELSLTEPLPSYSLVDNQMLEKLLFSLENTSGIKNSKQLIDHFREMRNAVAHFFNSKADMAEFDMSHGADYYKFSLVSSAILYYAHKDFDGLHAYFQRHISSRLSLGNVLPEPDKRDEFIIRGEDCLEKINL